MPRQAHGRVDEMAGPERELVETLFDELRVAGDLAIADEEGAGEVAGVDPQLRCLASFPEAASAGPRTRHHRVGLQTETLEVQGGRLALVQEEEGIAQRR